MNKMLLMMKVLFFCLLYQSNYAADRSYFGGLQDNVSDEELSEMQRQEALIRAARQPTRQPKKIKKSKPAPVAVASAEGLLVKPSKRKISFNTETEQDFLLDRVKDVRIDMIDVQEEIAFIVQEIEKNSKDMQITIRQIQDVTDVMFARHASQDEEKKAQDTEIRALRYRIEYLESFIQDVALNVLGDDDRIYVGKLAKEVVARQAHSIDKTLERFRDALEFLGGNDIWRKSKKHL